MLVAAPRGCCTGGMFSSGIHALGPLGAGEDIVRVELSTVIVALVVGGVHALQADGSSSTVWSGIAEMKSSRPRLPWRLQYSTCIRLFLPGIHTKTSRVAAAACVRVREEVWAFLLTVKRDTKKFTIVS